MSSTPTPTNSKPIQAALHALERFNEQARQQAKIANSTISVSSSSSSTSTATSTTATSLNKSTKTRGIRNHRKSSSTSIDPLSSPSPSPSPPQLNPDSRPNLMLNTASGGLLAPSRHDRIELETIYSAATLVPASRPSLPNSTGSALETSTTTPLPHQHRRTSSLATTSTSSSSPSITAAHLPPSSTTASSVAMYDPTLDPGSPLSIIARKLVDLPPYDQEPVRRTLDRISSHFLQLDQPATPHLPHTNNTAFNSSPADKLPLAQSWTLFFSDTSTSSKTPSSSSSSSRHFNHHHGHQSSVLKAAEYQSGMFEVFSNIGDVQSLCAALIGFKKSVADRLPFIRSSCLETPGNGLGLIGMKVHQNLHFFKVGVMPLWEDPWNSKGGRLTISTPLALLDPTFESLVLLLAGGVLDSDSGPGGKVVGIVGSRRPRGDRIEVWLSGEQIGVGPDENWIKRVQQVIAREVGTNDAKAAKFKRHL